MPRRVTDEGQRLDEAPHLMDNLGFLAAAYTIIFAVIFLYVVFVWRRQARLTAEMRILEVKLEGLRAELTREAPPDSRSSGH